MSRPTRERKLILLVVCLQVLSFAAIFGTRFLFPEAPRPTIDLEAVHRTIEELRAETQQLEARVLEVLTPREDLSGSVPLGEAPPAGDLAPFAERLERALERLETFEPKPAEPALSETEKIERLKAEDGYLLAQSWLEAGKPGQAGEGFLRFLAAHPDHPDAKDLWNKARRALWDAGLQAKAIDVQKAIIEQDPEDPSLVSQLATLEKRAGRLDDAILSTERAIELARVPSQRMWQELYRAWYVQLRDGDRVALGEFRAVEQQIERLGFSDGKLGDKVRKHIREAEQRLAAE